MTTSTECQDQFVACVAGSTNPSVFRTTTVSYDPAQFNAPQGPNLLSSLAYTQKGRFPVKTTNAVGHTEYMAYETRHGTLLQKTGIDGVHARYVYDRFGRKHIDIQRCGTSSELLTTIDQYLAAETGTNVGIITVTRPPTGAVSWAYSDVLGRPLKTRVRGFSGDIIETGAKIYDAEGRLKTETKPRIEGQGTFKIEMTYDNSLGRIDHTVQELGIIDGSNSPAQEVVTYTYDGASITTERAVAGQTQNARRPRTSSAKSLRFRTAMTSDLVQVRRRRKPH